MAKCRYCDKQIPDGEKTCDSPICRAKRELEHYHSLFYRVERYKNRLQRVDGEFRRLPTVDYSVVKFSQTPQNDRLLELLAQMEALEAEISKTLLAAEEETREIERKIEEIEYPYCEILAQNYLEFKPLYEVAVNLSYDYRWLRKLHKKAIEMYSQVDLKRPPHSQKVVL